MAGRETQYKPRPSIALNRDDYMNAIENIVLKQVDQDSQDSDDEQKSKLHRRFSIEPESHRSIADIEYPKTITENSIHADKGLLAEIKQTYKKRKIALEKQIVYDNAHFVTQQKIIRLALTRPEEKEKQEKVKKVLDAGKSFIARCKAQQLKKEKAKAKHESHIKIEA